MTQNQIAYQNLKESQRANLAREAETFRSNVEREYETHRSNRAREDELFRSNRASEAVARGNLAQRAYEYDDMRAYEKARLVADTTEKLTKSAKNIADTIYTAKKTANPLSGIIGE